VFLVFAVLLVCGAFVVAEWRERGTVQVSARPWWVGGMGVFAITSVVKDAWERKIPYCMLLGLPYSFAWVARRLAGPEYATAVGFIAACAVVGIGVPVVFSLLPSMLAS
jgi:hypothetical protein